MDPDRVVAWGSSFAGGHMAVIAAEDERLARPGETGAMCSPDPLPGYGAMFEPGEPWVNAVAARVALRVGFHRPGRQLGRLPVRGWCRSASETW